MKGKGKVVIAPCFRCGATSYDSTPDGWVVCRKCGKKNYYPNLVAAVEKKTDKVSKEVEEPEKDEEQVEDTD